MAARQKNKNASPFDSIPDEAEVCVVCCVCVCCV
jgi:hypothetical protein